MVIALTLIVACSTEGPPLDPTSPAAPVALLSAAPTAEGCLTDPDQCPPRAWVESPAELPPGITVKNSDCTLFPFPARFDWDRHPTAGCSQKEWGNSGIYRQQARELHVTVLNACAGAQGDLDEIRLCSDAWKSRPTPYGSAGAAGCVIIWIEVTCGV